MLLIRTINLPTDNADLLPNQNILVKCCYEKVEQIN